MQIIPVSLKAKLQTTFNTQLLTHFSTPGPLGCHRGMELVVVTVEAPPTCFSNFVMAKRAEENRLFERAALRFLSEDDRGTV